MNYQTLNYSNLQFYINLPHVESSTRIPAREGKNYLDGKNCDLPKRNFPTQFIIIQSNFVKFKEMK